jgi:hypothetical protein
MRVRPIIAVGAIAAAALVTGGLSSAFASPDGEHGGGFNCTPGNTANAENQHDLHNKDDHGNGDDCVASAAVTTTTTTPAAVTPPAQSPTVSPAAAARPPTAVVTAQPRTAG